MDVIRVPTGFYFTNFSSNIFGSSFNRIFLEEKEEIEKILG